MLNLVAVDLGASSGRMMVGQYDGRALTLTEHERFSTLPVTSGRWLHTNIQFIFERMLKGLVRSATHVGVVSAVGIDSWAVDFGLIDRFGSLIDHPRHYRDERHAQAMKAVVERIGIHRLFQETGIQILPFNTLFQLYGIQMEEPNVFDRAATLLLLPDLLNYMLTGEMRAEWTNATTTQMIRVQTRSWMNDLLQELGLPTTILPTIAQPGSVLSRLAPMQRGMHENLCDAKVVHVASHDTASAVAAVPDHADPYLYISSGTWSLVGTVVQRPITTPLAEHYNFSNEGGIGNYRFLKNVMGLWLIQEIQREVQAVVRWQTFIHCCN
ncbi:hypothetical protein GCM10025858_26100 [Alicyclobacillus sacchari]|uniref:rhamnulokinase n=1 Tax=Alicyclobacillus sacchari TaxID=392010 RepID=UPI0023E9F5AB|nr:FGGY family carbohydrate kinase [Alicyclobacillus sacchari]GMA58107.1 hypothetical protein GCM10025858_26100 [Alicyclobacillus sacchari]